METEQKLYVLNDNITFRKCSLFDEKQETPGDCTNYKKEKESWVDVYSCKQKGIHFHCTKHPEIELDFEGYEKSCTLFCPKCNSSKYDGNFNELINKCLRILNRDIFSNAKIIRIDDYYYPEIKIKDLLKEGSDYFCTVDIKKDRDNDTIIILYVGYKGSQEKAQFFIKPEKLQLTSDYKDLDPAKVLAKIEVTLKDRTLSQLYNDNTISQKQ